MRERIVGVPSLDSLVAPAPPGWIVEFYGDWRLVNLVAHHAVAEASARGTVAVVHVQEFGGLNPYLLARLSRARRGSPERILVARAFRTADIPRLVEEALRLGPHTLVVYDPYLYAPRDPQDYHALTRVTAAIRRAAPHTRRTLIFNRPTPRGRGRRPEGGSLHHHTAHIHVRLDPWSRGARATLTKHPARHTPLTTLVPARDLMVTAAWGGQRPLTEYL